MSIIHLQRITSDIAGWGGTSEVVAIFHTDAGHLTLHDRAYNAARHIGSGKSLQGADGGPDEPGRAGRAVRRDRENASLGNADLLAGIKVNTDAGARMIQLVQQGFVKITE